MPWGGAATNGANIDIAVLGFSDTENNARAIVGLDPVTESTPNDTDNSENNEATTDKADTTDTGAANTESDVVTESTDTVAEETKKGCGSSLSYGGVVLIIAIGIAAITIFRKNEYNC